MRLAGALFEDLFEDLLEDLLEALLEDLAGEADFFFLSGDCRGNVSSPGGQEGRRAGGVSSCCLTSLDKL